MLLRNVSKSLDSITKISSIQTWYLQYDSWEGSINFAKGFLWYPNIPVISTANIYQRVDTEGIIAYWNPPYGNQFTIEISPNNAISSIYKIDGKIYGDITTFSNDVKTKNVKAPLLVKPFSDLYGSYGAPNSLYSRNVYLTYGDSSMKGFIVDLSYEYLELDVTYTNGDVDTFILKGSSTAVYPQ